MKTSTHRPVVTHPRNSSPRCGGFSLIELLVALLLFAIVLGGWFLICNFQAIRKEALRRVAVEEAAGMLDFMAREPITAPAYGASVRYVVNFNPTTLTYGAVSTMSALTTPMPGDARSIGYCLRVRTGAQVVNGRIGTWVGTWAAIDLYDEAGVTNPSPAFASMSVLMRSLE